MTQNQIRLLDIDDLIVMKMLLTAPKLKDISALLGISAPALSHRLRKYRENIPGFDVKTIRGEKWVLSEFAKTFCEKATLALDLFTTTEEVVVDEAA